MEENRNDTMIHFLTPCIFIELFLELGTRNIKKSYKQYACSSEFGKAGKAFNWTCITTGSHICTISILITTFNVGIVSPILKRR